MIAIRPRPEPGRPPGWTAADEKWVRDLLAKAPPLSPSQRDRLRALLDLGGDHDDAA